MPEVLHHPTSGEPIELAADERLCRIAWPGVPVVGIVAQRLTTGPPMESWPTGWRCPAVRQG